MASILLALLLALAPSASAEEKVPAGERITLFGGAFQVFPEGEPFHIVHGWSTRKIQPGAEAEGLLGFDLAVDGVQRREDYVDRFTDRDPTGGDVRLNRNWVHNFPDGLTGSHTFTGHWFGGCAGVVWAGLAPGPCEHPAAITTAIAPLTITVAFVP